MQNDQHTNTYKGESQMSKVVGQILIAAVVDGDEAIKNPLFLRARLEVTYEDANRYSAELEQVKS
jgi:hypothetical protein